MSRARVLSTILAIAVLALAFVAVFVPLNRARPKEDALPGGSPAALQGADRPTAVLRGREPAVHSVIPGSAADSADTDGSIGRSKLHVKVVERGSGRPIADACVFSAARRGGLVPRARSATTGPEGECELLVREEDGHICAFASGYVPVCEPFGAEGVERVLELHEGSRISGRVLDESGRPVADAQVIGTMPASIGVWPRCEDWLVAGATGFVAQSDEEGRFATTGLRDGERYVLYGRAEGYAPSAGWRTICAEAGDEDVVVPMAACAVIRLRFLDGVTREHLPGVAVAAFDNTTTRALTWSWGGTPDSREQNEPLWRNDIQVFLLAPRRPKKWAPEDKLTLDVRCRRLGYEPQLVRVAARLGQTRTIDVPLERTFKGEWVCVRPLAEFESGMPYDGDLVTTFTGDAGQVERLLSFRDGVSTEEFLLPPGSYSLVARGARWIGDLWNPAGPGGGWIAGPSSAPPVLRLLGNAIRLRVLDPDGRRVMAYRVGRVSPPQMPTWAAVWSLDLLEEDGTGAPDAPFYVGPTACEIHVRTEDGLRGAVNYSGTGDGSPVDLVIPLTK